MTIFQNGLKFSEKKMLLFEKSRFYKEYYKGVGKKYIRKTLSEIIRENVEEVFKDGRYKT